MSEEDVTILKRAASMLDAQADGLHRDNATSGGSWPPGARRARDLFFSFRKVARQLREMAERVSQPGQPAPSAVQRRPENLPAEQPEQDE